MDCTGYIDQLALHQEHLTQLKVIAGTIGTVLLTFIGALWKYVSKREEKLILEFDKRESRLLGELSKERNYIKDQDRENVKLLNDFKDLIKDLTRGIEKDIPEKIDGINKSLTDRTNEITNHINTIRNEQGSS